MLKRLKVLVALLAIPFVGRLFNHLLLAVSRRARVVDKAAFVVRAVRDGATDNKPVGFAVGLQYSMSHRDHCPQLSAYTLDSRMRPRERTLIEGFSVHLAKPPKTKQTVDGRECVIVTVTHCHPKVSVLDLVHHDSLVDSWPTAAAASVCNLLHRDVLAFRVVPFPELVRLVQVWVDLYID